MKVITFFNVLINIGSVNG